MKILSILLQVSPGLVLSFALIGCSTQEILKDRTVDYKKETQADERLEIPPDLTRSSIQDTLVVPDLAPAQSATYSEYASEREGSVRRGSVRKTVLPRFDDITVKRDGNQRWLLIQAAPEDVWPKVVDYWRENGILLIEEDPTIGIMETGWLENRADIKSDFITDTLRSFLDGFYASATRDQFRVRLEPGEEPGTTELFLTHRGMEEVLVASSGGEPADRPVWQGRPNDPGLEAEMLRRVMVYLGVGERRAKRALATREERPRSRLVSGRDGLSVLTVDEEFPTAWRLTGVALDRVGFTVEDRNRSDGIYYVRYDDPTTDTKDEGMLAKLAFWRSDDDKPEDDSKYQVSLQADGEKTRVVVLDRFGKRDTTATSRRILTLLHEQIR